MSGNVQSVGEVTQRIQEVLEGTEDLQGVRVRGEVSGLKRPGSGHLYFTLKDAEAQLSCVVWAAQARRIRFELVDGLAVVTRGDVGLYAQGGRLQLYVSEIAPEGAGAAAAALEALRRRLAAEGLFDEARKRPLPPFPRRIAVVTSRSGAVLHDVATVMARLAPSVQILLAPVRVQGETAGAEVAAAIGRLNALPPPQRPEIILVARGGGSAEDLSAFNEEVVVRALAHSAIPTVSAIGHESDVTLADAAADVRAATPSAAAEMATADLAAAGQALHDWQTRMGALLQLRVRAARDRLETLVSRSALREPDRAFRDRRQRVDELAGLLHSLSPLATLGRGYAVARRADGSVLTRAAQARVGETLAVVLSDGEVEARVTSARSKEEKS